MRILCAGDGAIILELGADASFSISRRVFRVFRELQSASPPGFIAALPTLRSVTVQFDPQVTDHEAIATHLLALVEEKPESPGRPSSWWRIPVCYDGELAPDLAIIAARVGISSDALAELHTQQRYRVYMVGGFPGFAFMGDLPPLLQAPRLASPRTAVPAGSVAIAGRMTAIYPAATPGGWNLIGRTPLRLFNADWQTPAPIGPGDEVEFSSISKVEFENLACGVCGGEVSVADFRVR